MGICWSLGWSQFSREDLSSARQQSRSALNPNSWHEAFWTTQWYEFGQLPCKESRLWLQVLRDIPSPLLCLPLEVRLSRVPANLRGSPGRVPDLWQAPSFNICPHCASRPVRLRFTYTCSCQHPQSQNDFGVPYFHSSCPSFWFWPYSFLSCPFFDAF